MISQNTKAYAVRQRSTGYFIPILKRGYKRGGSHSEPSCTEPARLFPSRKSAQAFLGNWLQGIHERKYSQDYDSGYEEDYVDVKPQPHRNKSDTEIVEFDLVEAQNNGERTMAKQLVMDQTGHTEHVFDKANKVELSAAMERFDDLVKKGYTPAVLKADGNHQVTRKFDPTADQTLFIPQLQGGVDNLSPKQRKQFEAKRYFTVKGSDTGIEYRVCVGTQLNIFRDKPRHQVICFTPKGISTDGDAMLAQKIALENFELKALKVANIAPNLRPLD
jgi:hypothetical protein